MRRPDNWAQVYSACQSSIEAFVNLFMEKAAYAETPPFHREIYKALADDNNRKLAIIAPRGHSKSTVVSIAYPLWRICFNPLGQDFFCIQISESQSQAINFLQIIKYNLESNRLLRAYFGDLVTKDKWSEAEIVTKNNCRLVAKGTGQKVRGMIMGREGITRPNLIILDDFESETNSATPEAIDKNIEWITKAVEPSLADDGRLVTVGTIIRERAYLNRVKDDPAFKTLFYQAILDGGRTLKNGRPLWPERFSIKKLMEIKASYEARGQADAFWQEYMNIPISLEDQTFKDEWYKHFDYEFVVVDNQSCLRVGENLVPINVGVGVDLAIAVNKSSDFTVIAALGTDSEDNKYLLHYERIKTKNMQDILDKIFDVGLQFNVLTINIETVQFQQVIATEFRRQMVERGKVFGVVETKPRTNKDARIQSLQGLFVTGRFHHRAWMMAFESELYAFPNAAHDDILDSVYLANMVSHPPEIGSFKETKGANHGFREEFQEGSSWITM